MQAFITYVLILSFISPCLCTRLNGGTTNAIFDVMQYGARGDGRSDDSEAFSRAWSSTCKSSGMSTLVIPAGRSFMVSKANFSGPCNAKILIQIQGKIVAPSKKAWKAMSYWITVEYLDELTIDGLGTGELDGYGSSWWQCQPCSRPVVLFINACKSLNVRNLRISNSPGSHVGITMCRNSIFSHISINSPATSPNTDGFDIADSTNILIQDSSIKAGDDCIAINSGSSFINATRVTCGPGHGISVGSLGKDGSHDIVSNVYVRNCTFIGTMYGARIKTFSGGSGYAKVIIFEQIILTNAQLPIIIDQHYNATQDSNVAVSDVIYRGFVGTTAGEIAINLNCDTHGCFNILLDQNKIVSAQRGKKLSVYCKNAHGTVRNTIPNVPCLSN